MSAAGAQLANASKQGHCCSRDLSPFAMHANFAETHELYCAISFAVHCGALHGGLPKRPSSEHGIACSAQTHSFPGHLVSNSNARLSRSLQRLVRVAHKSNSDFCVQKSAVLAHFGVYPMQVVLSDGRGVGDGVGRGVGGGVGSGEGGGVGGRGVGDGVGRGVGDCTFCQRRPKPGTINRSRLLSSVPQVSSMFRFAPKGFVCETVQFTFPFGLFQHLPPQK
jgi:hypothetical protein